MHAVAKCCLLGLVALVSCAPVGAAADPCVQAGDEVAVEACASAGHLTGASVRVDTADASVGASAFTVPGVAGQFTAASVEARHAEEEVHVRVSCSDRAATPEPCDTLSVDVSFLPF